MDALVQTDTKNIETPSKSKIKICHIASGDLWAGAEAQIATLLGALGKYSKYEIHAIIYNSGKLAKELRKSGIQIYIIEESQNNFFSLTYKTYKILKKKRFAILHTHRYKENLIGFIISLISCKPCLIATIHGHTGLLTGYEKVKWNFYNFINRKIINYFFNRIVVVSNKLKTELSNNGCSPEKIIKIHNCVNKVNIKTKVDAYIIKKKLKISSDTKIVGSAGRLVRIKGYKYLIYGAKKILKEIPNTKFIIAGEGPIKQELIKETERLGIRKNFIFPGFIEDIYDLISTFDLFVLPSIKEGIPIVILEAMVLGIPIVATNVGGIPEILKHKVSGLLVAPGNSSELASTCLYGLKKSNKVRSMAENAKEIVATKFSPKKIALKTSELYQDLISNHFHD